MKETLLDIQSRSMRENRFSSGIPEDAYNYPEGAIREFMKSICSKSGLSTLLRKNIYTNLLNLHATNYLIIMVGDYNTVLSTSMDRKGHHSTNYHHRALREITNIMDTL
jgi:hypothetical protein